MKMRKWPLQDMVEKGFIVDIRETSARGIQEGLDWTRPWKKRWRERKEEGKARKEEARGQKDYDRSQGPTGQEWVKSQESTWPKWLVYIGLRSWGEKQSPDAALESFRVEDGGRCREESQALSDSYPGFLWDLTVTVTLQGHKSLRN